MPFCWLYVREGMSPCGQRFIAISPIGMPDSRIITDGSGTLRVPTLCGSSPSAIGTGEAATLSLQPQHLQCRSPDGRHSPEPWGPALMSHQTLHESAVTDGQPNRPLERPCLSPLLDFSPSSAGRSALRR